MNDELKNFWNDEKRILKAEEEIKKERINLNNNNSKKEEKIKIEKTILNFNNNENNHEDNKISEKYFPKVLLIFFGSFILLTSFNFGVGLIISFIAFGILWLYCGISVLTSDFKKENNKTIWIILLIFIPVVALLYPDLRKIQTKQKG